MANGGVHVRPAITRLLGSARGNGDVTAKRIDAIRGRLQGSQGVRPEAALRFAGPRQNDLLGNVSRALAPLQLNVVNERNTQGDSGAGIAVYVYGTSDRALADTLARSIRGAVGLAPRILHRSATGLVNDRYHVVFDANLCVTRQIPGCNAPAAAGGAPGLSSSSSVAQQNLDALVTPAAPSAGPSNNVATNNVATNNVAVPNVAVPNVVRPNLAVPNLAEPAARPDPARFFADGNTKRWPQDFPQDTASFQLSVRNAEAADLCLGDSAGTSSENAQRRLVLGGCSNRGPQSWTLSEGEGGYYRVSPPSRAVRGLCLQAGTALPVKGGADGVWVAGCGTSAQQQWRHLPDRTGYFQLISRADAYKGQCLTAPPSPGEQVTMEPCRGTPNQLWRVR